MRQSLRTLAGWMSFVTSGRSWCVARRQSRSRCAPRSTVRCLTCCRMGIVRRGVCRRGDAGADHRRGEPHVVRQLLRGDVHPVPAGLRGADGRVGHRGGPGERGAQPAVGRPVRCGGRRRCAFGHRGDRPVHRALVRPRRALVLRAPARPGAHGGVQRGRRRGVRKLRMVACDRVLRRSLSDRDRGLVDFRLRGHRRRSCPPRRHDPHAGRKGSGGLAALVMSSYGAHF